MDDLLEMERIAYRLTSRVEGATKAEIKQACGKNWSEEAWKRMTIVSRQQVNPAIWYDKKDKVWVSD